MAGHGAYDAKKIPWSQYLARIFANNRHILLGFELSLSDYKEAMGVLLLFDNSVRPGLKIDHLEKASARAGLSLVEINNWISAHSEQWPAQLEDNGNALERHHWGVPTMVFEDEPFFGQDKIELLIWRMKQQGLQLRNEG